MLIQTHNYFIPIHVETVSNNIPCKYEHKNRHSMVQYEYIVMLLHSTDHDIFFCTYTLISCTINHEVLFCTYTLVSCRINHDVFFCTYTLISCTFNDEVFFCTQYSYLVRLTMTYSFVHIHSILYD